jgi:hypothetical protein
MHPFAAAKPHSHEGPEGRMTRWLRAAIAAAIIPAGTAHAAQVRLAPADFVVLNPTNPGAGYFDLIIHAAGIRAGVGESFHVESLRIEILAKGAVRLTEDVPVDRVLADTERLAHAPVRGFMTGQLLDPAGADGVFSAPTVFASRADLTPGEALMTVRHHFSVGFEADEVRVIAVTRNRDGATSTTQASVPVRPYRSPITYHFPLQGAWLMQAVPAIEDHHRLNPSTEFAADYFKIDDQGATFSGDMLNPNNAYAYGRPVAAAAAGTVVAVVSDQAQDRAAFLPRAGETREQAGQRIETMMTERARRNFAAAEAGNFVTLRHQQDGVVEYSSYGHLKAGSVRVKLGASVVQGQVIGEVGDTGDSPAVHLHFQVNAGPDPFTAKSLPFVFADVRNARGDTELGRIVTNTPKP